MTAPQEDPPQEQPDRPSFPVPKPEGAEDADASALVPTLLAIYAAYLLLRGSRDRTALGWRQVSEALQLRSLIGGQLGAIALRAMMRLQVQTGRAGDEFWGVAEDGAEAGVQAGLRSIAEALIWTDQSAEGDPVTKDAGGNVPTASAPPLALARMVAQAVANATVVALAAAAGWKSKTWHTKRDLRVRDAHVSMEGQVQPIGSPFLAPGGVKLRYPGDPAAPIHLVINCRCWVIPSRL